VYMFCWGLNRKFLESYAKSCSKILRSLFSRRLAAMQTSKAFPKINTCQGLLIK
jgi:hypothetical protein